MNFRMLSLLAVTACAVTALGHSPASAAETLHMVSIQQALATPDAQTELDHKVHFYFGDAEHPPVIKDFGGLITHKENNAVTNSDNTSCNRAFLSAVVQLQTRAEELGADSVINIHSYYKQHDVSNREQAECYVGFFTSGVTLMGEFVKTKAP